MRKAVEEVAKVGGSVVDDNEDKTDRGSCTTLTHRQEEKASNKTPTV
jgi:hypothetical protein